MDTVLIIVGLVVVLALVLFLVKRGKERKINRLEDISGERRERAARHDAHAAQLESQVERERAQAEQHKSAAREAEEKLADKRGP